MIRKPRKRLYITIGCLGFSFFTAAAAAHPGNPLKTGDIAHFFKILGKSWQGRATHTPVGPRPYDINFKRNALGHLEGAAHPSEFSTHYWTFYQEESTLKLRFLSTFGGNTQPLFLTATKVENNTWMFSSLQPRFVEVHIKPRIQTLEILIILRGEPHVEIHLKQQAK